MQALTRLNHFGLCLAPTSKINLQDEAGKSSKMQILKYVKENPMIKITGDNLDVMVRSAHLSLINPNRSLHLFASNMIFPRIVHPGLQISNEKPVPPVVVENDFLLNDSEKQQMMECYKVLISRILKSEDDFKWLEACEDQQQFEYCSQMRQKSKVIQLPIMLKNETKHEDCLSILDEVEDTVTSLFIEAFGSDEKLKEHPVIIGGDQLTRCRLQEAKALRSLSRDSKKRFDDIGGIFIEFWHLKQDILEKAFKVLFSMKSCRQPGSLAFFKCRLHRTDITGKVKGKFQPHFEFLLLIGKNMIVELAREFFSGFEIDMNNMTKSEKRKEIGNMLEKFLCHYHFLQFDLESQCAVTSDQQYAYCLNLCHWFLLIMALEETAKTGNIHQVIPNLKAAIPFLYSTSALSKYMFECMDFIYKVEYTLSPLMKLHVLESCFVNTKGGTRGNVEADLVQEHSVRAQKALIRQLGANKTEKAILRTASAGVIVDEVCRNLDVGLGIKPKSTRHSKSTSSDDEEVVKSVLKSTKPFLLQENRNMMGFSKLGKTPVSTIDRRQLKFDLEIMKHRIVQGSTIFNVDEMQKDTQHECDGEDDLPPL